MERCDFKSSGYALKNSLTEGCYPCDFTYIKDVIQANILAGRSDVAGEIFNIGKGSPITLTELAKVMLKISNKDHLKIKYIDPRSGDILHSYVDISKTIRLLSFEPIYNQEQGLKEYFKWYSDTYGIKLNTDYQLTIFFIKFKSK